MIDSTITCHQHSAGAQKCGEDQPWGETKGIKHQDQRHGGGPGQSDWLLRSRQACDLDGADVLLPRVEAQTVLADKGYDDDRVITPLCRQERPWSFRPNVTATSSVLITTKNLISHAI